MAHRKLYITYVRLAHQHEAYERPVYCYACSSSHAAKMAISYCVDELEWPLESIKLTTPWILPNFVR